MHHDTVILNAFDTVILSVVKDLAILVEMLRFAQHDRSGEQLCFDSLGMTEAERGYASIHSG